MRLVRTFPIATAVALAAIALFVADQILLNRDTPRQSDDVAMIDFSKRRYHAPSTVVATFAAHGIVLERVAAFNGYVTFGSRRASHQVDALQVLVAPHDGVGSWGPKLMPYDARFANVLVTYGGRDERLLARAEAAVAALR